MSKQRKPKNFIGMVTILKRVGLRFIIFMDLRRSNIRDMWAVVTWSAHNKSCCSSYFFSVHLIFWSYTLMVL